MLLVEIGESSFAVDHLELSGPFRTEGASRGAQAKGAHQPFPTGLGFDLALWSGESCLREYVLHLLKLEKLYKVFFENKVMRALVNVAPGLNDVAILGKITSGIRRVGPPLHYDHIIVDCPSTGHAAALFRAPQGLAQAIQVGPMAHHSEQMVRLLKDPKTSALVTVCLPEEMPVTESVEFIRDMHGEFGFEHFAVMNRVLQIPLASEDFDSIRAGETDPALIEWSEQISEFQTAQTKAMNDFKAALQVFEPAVDSIVLPRYLSLSGRQLVESIAQLLLRDSFDGSEEAFNG